MAKPQFGTYRAVFHARPATAFAKPGGRLILNFPTPDRGLETVTIMELVEKTGEQLVPVGSEFRTEVHAESLDEAIMRGGKLADGVASFITLVTGVGMQVVHPVLCYEITDGKAERGFLQYSDAVTFVNASRRVLSHNLLIDRLDRFHKLADPAASDRIGRAIRWYRRGVGSTDLFDRFVAYWIGLEALNKLLQERLGVDDDLAKGPDCGHEWIATPTVSGIREFVLQYFDDGRRLYQQLHGLRIDIMHSKISLDSLAAEVTEASSKAGNVLLAAISYLLLVDPPWDFPDKTLTNAFPFRAAVEAKLLCDRVENAFVGQEDPRFQIEHSLVKLYVDREAGGKIHFTVTTNLKALVGPQAQLRVQAWRLYGEGEGKVEIIAQKNHKSRRGQ